MPHKEMKMQDVDLLFTIELRQIKKREKNKGVGHVEFIAPNIIGIRQMKRRVNCNNKEPCSCCFLFGITTKQ